MMMRLELTSGAGLAFAYANTRRDPELRDPELRADLSTRIGTPTSTELRLALTRDERHTTHCTKLFLGS